MERDPQEKVRKQVDKEVIVQVLLQDSVLWMEEVKVWVEEIVGDGVMERSDRNT